MKKEHAEKWVNALRSGEYRQCKGKLSDGKGSYCCLGVLGKINPELNLSGCSNFMLLNYHLAGLNNDTGRIDNKTNFYFNQGYTPGNFIAFSTLNDIYNLTFDEIADVVQAEYLLDNYFEPKKEGK